MCKIWRSADHILPPDNVVSFSLIINLDRLTLCYCILVRVALGVRHFYPKGQNQTKFGGQLTPFYHRDIVSVISRFISTAFPHYTE